MTAMCGLTWAGQRGLEYRYAADAERLSSQIVQGATFLSVDVDARLARLPLADAAALCEESLLLSAVVLQGYSLDVDRPGQDALTQFDNKVDTIGAAAYRLVTCSPYQSFGWLMLYWTRIMAQGVDSRAVDLLTMSYDTGSNEAWIAARRNRLAIRAFAALPSGLQNRVIDEYVALLSADLGQISAENYRLASPAVRTRLIARVIEESADVRRRLASSLSAEGIDPPDALDSGAPLKYFN